MKIYSFIIGILFSVGMQAQYTFYARDINNNQVALSSLQGEKLTVLDFWATWCKPCVQLIPKLVEIDNRYSEQGVRVLGVNIDDTRSINKVKPFTESLQVSYPILLDTDKELMDEMNVTAVPALVIIDAKGQILWQHEGFSLGDEELIERKLDELLQR